MSDTNGSYTPVNNVKYGPQAKDDSAQTSENAFILIDVLANDLGGNAKVLWSLDQTDQAIRTADGVKVLLASGAKVWFQDGKLAYEGGRAWDGLGAGATAVDTFTYAIRMSTGVVSYATVTITITGTNDGPVAVADTASGTENQILTIDVLANDTDADDGHALTLTAAAAPSGKGAASIADNRLVFTPGTDFDHLAAGATEVVTLTYTMKDDQGASSSSTVTVTITGTNDGPLAVADTASGTENQILTIDVLANDTDVDDGHLFTLTAAAAPTGKGAASIVNNQLVFAPGTDFDHLAAGATEVVTLTYTMQDEHGASSASTVTVTITGTNDGPLAVADTAAGTENGTLIVDVLANDTDVDDGHAFILTAAAAPSGKGAASISNNRLVFNPGTDFDHLAAGATEIVTLSYTMKDNQGAESDSSVTITITGTNDGPLAVADSASGTENQILVIDVLGNDTDVDDGHVFTLVAAAAPSGKGAASIADNRLVFTPGTDFDHLAAGATEVVILTYTMQDEHGASSSSTVAITVSGANDAPVVSGPLAAAATEDGAVVAIDGLANASDVDDGAALAVQPPATLPAGVTFDPATNVFRLDPAHAAYQSLASGAIATVTVHYAVTDGTASTPASLSWTVTGTNDSPVVTSGAAAASGSVVEAGSIVAGIAAATGTLTSSDVDAGATAGWSGSSDGVYGSFAIDAQGVWTYTLDDSRAATEALAPGQIVSDSFTATVTDEHGASAQQTVTIQITGSEDNRAPTAEDVTLSGRSGVPGGSGVAIPPYNNGSGMIFTRLVDSNGDGVADTPDAPSILSGGYGTGLATGDIDGDGDVDMVTINGNQIWTYTNTGDTNGDGRVDFVSTHVATMGNGSQDIGLTDLNGDGNLDIVVSSYGSLIELINVGDGNGNAIVDDFAARSVSTNGSGGYTYGIATGDVDGDGLADIVIPNYENYYYGGQPVTIMFNRGDTDGDGQINYVSQGLYPGTNSAMGASIGDLNGDGRADLVISRWDGQGLQVMLGQGDTNGDGQIEFAVSNVTIGDHVMETTLADLDGDGDLDLASSGSNGYVHISLNRGDTDGDGNLNFTTTDYHVGYSTYGLAVTDLDGDGDLDVFAPNQGGYWNGNTASYLNNVGDTNGDGAPDFNIVQVTNVPSGWDAEPLDVGVGGGSGAREDGPLVTGSFVGGDADSEDVDHLTFEILSEPAEGSVVNNGDGTFGFDPGTDFQDLALGETRTVTFTYRAVDPQGAASAPATVTVTVAGANDGPVVTSSSAAASGSVTEAGNLDDGTVVTGTATAGGTLTASDADNGATATWSAVTTLQGTYGTFSIDAAGHWSYALDNSRPATQALAAGATVTEQFTARVTDDKGAKADQVVTVTVNGTNDSPVAVADVSGNGGGEGATALGAAFLVNTLTQNYQGQSAVTGLSDGGFVVSYNSAAQFGGHQGIALQRFDASGTKVGGEIIVAGSYGNYAGNSAVTALSNGGFAVSWVQNGNGNNQDYDNTFVQLYDAQGAAVGSPVQVNSTVVYSQYEPSITALADGGFIVTFNDNSAYANNNYNQATDVRAQIFSSTGAKVGGEFMVNSNVDGDQYQSNVVTLASGNFVVAWQDSSSGNSNVLGQMFTASGQRVGGTMTLGNVSDGSSKQSVSLTALANGGFVAAFTSYRNDGTQNYHDVHATLFDSSGNQVGIELVINTTSLGSQHQPAISALSDGSFVIVWVDNSAYYGNSPDYNRGEDIKGQLVAADGTLVGGEFLVGTSPQGGQYEPSITTLAGGDIVVTWTDYSNAYGDGDTGVIAQIYAFDKNDENEIVTIDVLENDTDVDSGATFSLVSVTQPSKGSVSIVDGKIVFDPGTDFDHLAKNARETVTVTYVMRDEHGATSTATTAIIVTGTNDAPVVSGAVSGTAVENGSASTLDAFANAGDLDDNAVFTAVIGILPAGVAYSAATHSFSLNTDHASFQSLAPGESKTVTVSYGISDGTATSPAIASWTVTGTYDAPVVTGTVSGIATEDGAQSTLNALANAVAVDNGSTLSVVDVPATLPAGVTYNAATRSFTLNPADPAYQSLAQGQTTTVSVTYGVSDGTTTLADTVKWTVTGTNDIPTVSGAVTGTATEDGASVTLAALTGAADVDSGATLSVTSIGALPSGVTWNAATQSFTLNPAHAAYQSLAAGATTIVTVSYRVTDGTSSVPQTASWVVTGTNDAPVVSGPVATTATEDGSISIINARAQTSDVDAGNTLTVVDVPATLPAGVTYDAANQTFSINPADSAYQSLAPGETVVVQVNYGVSDGTVTSAASARWTVTGTNDAPKLGLDVPATGPTATFVENGSAVALTGPGVAVDDIGERDLTSLKVTIGGLQDGSAERLALGTATVQLGSNASGSFTVGGEAFTYSYVASTRVLTITANDTRIAPAALEALIETMAYANVSEAPTAGSRTFAFVATDASGATSATQTARVDVVAVNDAPAGADRTLTATEDTPLPLTAANFALTDPDGNALGAVRIVTLPGAGSLTLNGVAVTAGQLVSAADIAAGKLVFAAAANANGSGYASLTFQVQDNGGTANGGQDTDASPNMMTINVTAVNDPVTDVSLSANTTPENVPSVTVGVLSATDADVGQTFTYTIRPGLDGALFTIVGDELRVGGTGLDYEQAASRQVTVRATDPLGNFFDRTFTIQIADSNEFTLTTANDNFTAGDTNDQVLANSLSLNPGDQINSGGGADELLLFGNGAFNLSTLASYSGIETVRLINLTASAAVLSLRNGIQNDVKVTGTGATTITLNNLASTVTGGDGADTVNAGSGDMIANTGNGNDVVSTGSGLATVNTGEGFDIVQLGSGAAQVDTGNANDTVTTGSGTANIVTGQGGDTVNLYGTGNVTVATGTDGDVINHTVGTGTIDTGAGADLIRLGNGQVSVNTGSEDDTIVIDQNGYNSAQTINGGAGNDTLVVNGSRDLTAQSLTSLEILNIQGAAVSNAAQLAQFTTLTGSAAGKLTVADAVLDWTGKTLNGITVYSTNASGTLFKVSSVAAAQQIFGGNGDDTIQVVGAALTADQRDVLFATTSIETLIDSSGTYFAPPSSPGLTRLTTANDTVTADPGDSTVNATAITFGTGDVLAGGGGVDKLAIYGSGTFNLNSYNVTGYEEIRLINNTATAVNLTLKTGETTNVTATGTGSTSITLNNMASTVATGAGSDTVQALNGASTISTGTGNDRIFMGNGLTQVDGGDHDDQIFFDWNGFNGASTANGGNGFDYLYFNGSRDATALSFSNFEYLSTNGAIQLTTAQIAQFQYLTGNGSAGSRIIFSESTVDLTNKIVSNVSLASSNATGTTFTVNSAAAALGVIGGAGDDTISAPSITLSASDREYIFATTAVDRIVDASGTYLAPAATPGTIRLTGGNDLLPAIPDSLTVTTTATAFTSGDNLAAGNTGTDELRLYGGGTFNFNNLAGFSGFEQVTLLNSSISGTWGITLRNGVATNLVSAGTANVDVTGSDTASTISLGAGNDRVWVNAGGGTISTDGGSDVITMQGAGGATIDAGSGNDTLYFGTGQSSVDMGSGSDHVFDVYGFAAGSVLSGGADFDYLRFNSSRDLTTVTVSNFEYLALETANITVRMSNAQLAQFSNVFGTTGTKIVTSDALFDLSGRSTGTVAFLSDNAAGTLFKVSSAAAAFQVVGGSGQDGVEAVGFTFTVDQRTALLNGASVEYIVEGNTIHGGSGNNILTGGASANTIYGNAGNDTIDGGAGADILYGGDGNDTFMFQAGQANGDSILDFSGNGAAAGDSLLFEGFGTAAEGANFVQIDATHWQINSADGTLHEIVTVSAGTVFNPADITFG